MQIIVVFACFQTSTAIPFPGFDATTDEIIRYYFNQGYTAAQICGFMMLVHGFRCSITTVKRIKRRLGLRRRNNEAPLICIAEKIAWLHRQGYSNLGYKSMWKFLNVFCNMRATQSTVRLLQQTIDQEGVYLRSCRRLRRRQYFNHGPNYLIHVDGYDKLKPYGFPIHGAIDGFSRKILWLKVCPSNNNPRYIARFYIDYVKQLRKVPRLIRTDNGTENAILRDLQLCLRMNHHDQMAGYRSHQNGRSTGNQRIERLWGSLATNFTQFWRNFFQDLRDSGAFNDSDPLHIECIRFCFFPILQQQLDAYSEMWNAHRIRSQRNVVTQFTGIPNIMFHMPEVYGSRDHSFPLPCNLNTIDELSEVHTEAFPIRGCCEEFLQIVERLSDQNRDYLPAPITINGAKELFCCLTETLHI